jgi:small ligand-binding sensory domain FIST
MSRKFAQSHRITDDLALAISELSAEIKAELNDNVDLVFVFAAGYSPSDFDQFAVGVKQQTGATHVLGCTCETVVGGEFELEQTNAVSIWAATLPDVKIVPMHLRYQRGDGDAAIVGWPDAVDGDWPDDSTLLTLGEPFGFPMDVLLERFNEDRPGTPVSGAMASGAQQPGQARLLLDDQTYDEGAVAIRISGTPIRTIVSQGCRPIGEPMVITKAERNICEGLGGKPAFTVLQDLFKTLPAKEQAMVQSGLHLGRVINEYQDKFEYGDFLIRNVIGVDPENNSFSVGDYFRAGQTVQFHIRDHESASFELSQMLDQAKTNNADADFGGALLFTCNGRGLNMFPDPHHDAAMVQTKSPCKLAGFFAAGEIGPVGDRNFLHGFTASLVIFD